MLSKRLYQGISIHSPRMGRDVSGKANVRISLIFQSTLPAWGETAYITCRICRMMISIHSPRMGRDQHWHQHGPIRMPFQSTLPAWGET